jgi:hypothetical protein
MNTLFDGLLPDPSLSELVDRLEAHETPPKTLVDIMVARPDLFADAPSVWEPFAGTGTLADTLRAAGHAVYASDVHDWGYRRLDALRDAWSVTAPPAPVVVTNPPFSRAHEAVEHFLSIGVERVLFFQAWNWFIASPDTPAGAFMDARPPQGVFPLLGRYSTWRMDIPDNERKSSAPIRWCWYVWRADRMPYVPPVQRIPRADTRVPVARGGAG